MPSSRHDYLSSPTPISSDRNIAPACTSTEVVLAGVYVVFHLHLTLQHHSVSTEFERETKIKNAIVTSSILLSTISCFLAQAHSPGKTNLKIANFRGVRCLF